MIDHAQRPRAQFRALRSAGLLSILALLVLACDRGPSAPPNVVLLVSDDQGYPDFGFMGN